MAYRMKALWRILALIWAYTGGAIIASVAILLGLVLMVFDVLWQLILGREGLTADGMAFGFVKESLMWFWGQTLFFLIGDGSFELLPDW